MYVNYNGTFYQDTQPIFPASSRVFRFGDGFFETLRVSNNIPLHFFHHFDRIQRTFKLLKISPAPEWDADFFVEQIRILCQKNNLDNARCRLTFFREGEGAYLPENETTSWLVETKPLSTPHYVLNREGLQLGTYKAMLKNQNYLSILKTLSSLLYVMASLQGKQEGKDEMVLFNEYVRVCETTHSNIFICKDQQVFTPALGEYCLDGVMRKVVLSMARSFGYEVMEKPLEAWELTDADEIFLTNSIAGIQWVGNFEGKQYRNDTASFLSKLLNERYVNV